MDYKFLDSKNTACFTCAHVVGQISKVLFVSHDSDDGYWQFLCGLNHAHNQAMVVAIGEIVESDQSLNVLAGLPLGYSAKRKVYNGEWVIIQTVN